MGKLVDVNLIDIPFNETKNEKKHQHIDFRYLLELEEQEAELAELPFFLLELEEAPEEFKSIIVIRTYNRKGQKCLLNKH